MLAPNSSVLDRDSNFWEDLVRLRRFSRSGKVLDGARSAIDYADADLARLGRLSGCDGLANHHELLLATKDFLASEDMARHAFFEMVPKGLRICHSGGWADQNSFMTTIFPSFFGSGVCDLGWCSLISAHLNFGARAVENPRLVTYQDNRSIWLDELGRPQLIELDGFQVPVGSLTWAYKSPSSRPEEAQLVKVTVTREVRFPVFGRYREYWVCKANPYDRWDVKLLYEGRVPTAARLGAEDGKFRTTAFLSLHRVMLLGEPGLAMFALELEPGTCSVVSLRYSRLSLEADLIGAPHERRLANQVLEQYR